MVGVVEHVLHRAELRDELGGGLLTHAGAAGDVVADVALEGQQVDDLAGAGDAVALAHLLRTAHLEALALERRAVHEHVVGDELAVVLVRRHHVGGEALARGLGGKRAYDVVGLIARHLDDMDAPCLDNLLDDGYGEGDVLGLFVALGLVFGVELVAEGVAAGRVEADGHVLRIFLAHNLVKDVGEAVDGRGVAPVRGVERVAYHRVVGAVYQCVCVEQKQFFLFHLCRVCYVMVW